MWMSLSRILHYTNEKTNMEMNEEIKSVQTKLSKYREEFRRIIISKYKVILNLCSR
jgi:hypothetical protein